jgi:lauroyl/myristoyl acyltransferase
MKKKQYTFNLTEEEFYTLEKIINISYCFTFPDATITQKTLINVLRNVGYQKIEKILDIIEKLEDIPPIKKAKNMKKLHSIPVSKKVIL